MKNGLYCMWPVIETVTTKICFNLFFQVSWQSFSCWHQWRNKTIVRAFCSFYMCACLCINIHTAHIEAVGVTQGSTCKTSTHNQYHPSPPISMENISSSSLDFQISLNWFIMCISTGFPSFSCRTIDMPASTNLIVLWTGCQTWVCEAVNLLAWI